MLQLARGWNIQVERGPDWLIIRMLAPKHGDQTEVVLSDLLWAVLEQHLTYRLVLEMSNVQELSDPSLEQLVLLQHKIHEHNGLLRVCGLTDEQFERLREAEPEAYFPRYQNCQEALIGCNPNQPR